MNKCLKQLIDKYEQRAFWDIRARHGQKAMLMPVKDWLEVFNNPTDHECFAAYKTLLNADSFKIQGVMTQDKKYFCYEGTPRYINVCGFNEPVTFVFISNVDLLEDALGYAPCYLYIRSRIPEEKKKTFSITHTNIAWKYLLNYPNFNDIKGFDDFLNRYTDEYGVQLCKDKGVNKAIDLYLNRRLKQEDDFKNIEWTTYSEVVLDALKANLFYIDNTKKYTNKFTKIYLDGGIYE